MTPIGGRLAWGVSAPRDRWRPLALATTPCVGRTIAHPVRARSTCTRGRRLPSPNRPWTTRQRRTPRPRHAGTWPGRGKR